MKSHKDKFLYIKPEDGQYKNRRCAMFDFDGTLAVKKNAAQPYLSETIPDNYVFLYGVEDYINNLIEEGILVVILTNQSNITNAKKEMFLNVYEHFKKKIFIFIAHKHNKYRKPNPGVLKYFKKENIDFFCGDAIGKDNNKTNYLPYNFSDCDYLFAKDNGIKFKYPRKLFGSNFETVTSNRPLIIMMGTPGSGKSSIAKRISEEKGHILYQRDVLGKLTEGKNFIDIKESLEDGKKVIIDETSRNDYCKKDFINIAKKLKIKYVVIWCLINGTPFNKERDKPVSHFPYTNFTKEFEEPNLKHCIKVN